MAKKDNQDSSSYESILKQANKKKSSIYGLKQTYPAYIVLVITLALSIFLWYFVGQKIKDDKAASFEKAYTSVVERLNSKYETDVQILSNIRGLYDNLIDVVRDYFQLYASIPTKTSTSIVSVLYAQQVPNKDLALHIYNVKSQGLYDFSVYPIENKDFYMPVTFIESYQKNKQRSGFDLFSEPFIKKEIETARDSNLLTATTSLLLRKPDTNGILIISPIYQKDSIPDNLENRRKFFRGIVGLEINTNGFFKSAIGTGVPSDTSITFKIVDINENNKEYSVFESENTKLYDKDLKPELVYTANFKIANRIMKVHFGTIPNFGGSFQKSLPVITLVTSLVLSILFFVFLLSVTTRKAAAIDEAERMTRSQRRIVDSSNDVIAVIDFNGIWKTMNPASLKLFGYGPDELISNKIDFLFEQSDDIPTFYSLINKSENEYIERVDFRMIDKNKKLRWVNWSFTVSKSDNLIYAIGRDVTLEKFAEEEAAMRANQNRLAEQLSRETNEFKSTFMAKLSHQLRNSLTGIIGYMQLLNEKLYDNEEEHDTYLNLASESTEELFTFVSDIIDVAADGGSASFSQFATFRVSSAIDQANEDIKIELPNDKQINVIISEESLTAIAIGDIEKMRQLIKLLLLSLTEGLASSEVSINVQENRSEGATEVQILGPANPIVETMIEIYKENTSNLIESIRHDKKDILLNFAIAASIVRLLNGSIVIESFGGDEGNIVQLSLPVPKAL